MEHRSDEIKLGGISKVSLPFYEPPPRKTSAEIINEARLAIRESQMAESSFISTPIKPLQTQRPFTPRNKERLLFGKKTKANRPPSSFSLRYLQNEAEIPPNVPESNMILSPHMLSSASKTNTRPIFTKQRSNSLSEVNDNKIFNIGFKEISLNKVKLPSLDHMKPLQKRKIFKNTSLDNLPEEQESNSADSKTERKAFSSPQERTDFNEDDSPFGRSSSKQKNLSQCLLLGPQNLNKIFDNRHIIENSETLFVGTGYLNRGQNPHRGNKVQNSILENKERNIDDVIDDLNNESNRMDNEDFVIELLEELYGKMEKANLLSTKVSSKMKIHVLKALYKFVESQNERLLLNIARVILGLKVTGNNLSGVCKLIFKVSKNDKNDYLFFQKNILELFLDALGRSSPLDDAEACVYGYGSVKFLTMNAKLLDKILSLGILQLMVLHIKIINNAKMDKTQMPEQTNHALFQLTGALRNIVSEETIYETFISCGAIQQLCQTMELFSADLDIISNISRIFSTISTNDCCCDSLVEYRDIYKVIIQLFDKYPGNEEIIVRLAYTLGNIVAKIDNTRVKFYHEKNSLNSLLNLWKIYLERTLKICSLKTDNELIENGNPEDVMIKVIRVIANVVINPEIGKAVNESFGCLLIDEFLKVLISNPFKKNEELVMSILSTLNNLSYYYTSDTETDIFHIKQVEIVEGITEYAKSRNKECVIESMRIMGNLSRSKITRDYIAESEVFKILLNILDKADLTLLKTTIGVFVNLMADNKSRNLFKNQGGVAKLITILKNYGQNDWLLGMLVCQVIWNYCIDTMDLYELIPDDEIQQLLVILADYLDEEKLFGITEGSEDTEVYVTQEYLIWEEFASVATNLLEKIEYFLDTFDQIHIENEATLTKDSSTNLSFAAW
ncbi:armadillo repeat-containing protein 2 isoform X1 [Tribolium castaneum]|uniref:Armadillo repeat-containing protein 2-like protein n=1 Tax=Tribolium castaneum TaxID=7070 RepID=A0A139WKC3_TRICA|nr:PREDICTED: armadillo repeat-containing protein 2 isoform X1 [Tribolium castaneum]KYB28498.1 Armadillo repeat-containing protein 2-like protein [Tribolium castaneum]|eukprot:XP_015833791.1 PREDICTED: armadillo repeat-containing protein 2 isoform X1 [Tribolium castaneum]